MKIDWFTVIAQILNFLILAWLLKRFLFKPIQNAIDKREKKITSQLIEAENNVSNAKKEQAEFKRKNEIFDQAKKDLMNKVVAEINEEREKLFEKARNEASELQSNLDKAYKETEENLNRDIEHKIQQEVFSITRKTLADLATQSLEEQLANILINRLKDLKKEEKEQFAEAFNQTEIRTNPIIVRSAFDLPENKQTEIINTVNEMLETKAEIQFKTTPELICGIELTSNGYKLAWSVSAYLHSLQKSISEK